MVGVLLLGATAMVGMGWASSGTPAWWHDVSDIAWIAGWMIIGALRVLRVLRRDH